MNKDDNPPPDSDNEVNTSDLIYRRRLFFVFSDTFFLYSFMVNEMRK